MNYKEMTIYTNSDNIEMLEAELLALGITGLTINDPKDFNDFLNKTQTYWDYVDEKLMSRQNQTPNIALYLPCNNQGEELHKKIISLLEELKNSEIDFGSLEVSVNEVKEEDWENNWKQYFKPIEIGEKFVVKPLWEDYDNIENRKIINIDPGMSFGTGQHETTRLCLEKIEKLVKENDEVLDLGVGSGILSIAALLMGARSVKAVDIDENCVKISRENVLVNDFDDSSFTALLGNIISDKDLYDEISKKKYDFIAANIVAEVLIKMAPLFINLLKDDGRILLSGIIVDRKEEVIKAFEKENLKILEVSTLGDWVSVLLMKG